MKLDATMIVSSHGHSSFSPRVFSADLREGRWLEIEVAFDGESKLPPPLLKFRQAEVADFKLRAADSPEEGILAVEFGRKPGPAAIRRKEFHLRRWVVHLFRRSKGG